jgi:DNA modification methylase
MYADARKWDTQPFDGLEAIVVNFKEAIIWGGNYYSLPPSRCWLSWEKSSRMATMADFELAWTNLDRPAKAWREDRNPDGKREHPTQKPLSLMKWCLKFVPIGVVVDPFAGSGTTLIAAKELGRRAVGIEIEERYCEIAAKRLSQEVFNFEPG